jgi:hypothetical protein
MKQTKLTAAPEADTPSAVCAFICSHSGHSEGFRRTPSRTDAASVPPAHSPQTWPGVLSGMAQMGANDPTPRNKPAPHATKVNMRWNCLRTPAIANPRALRDPIPSAMVADALPQRKAGFWLPEQLHGNAPVTHSPEVQRIRNSLRECVAKPPPPRKFAGRRRRSPDVGMGCRGRGARPPAPSPRAWATPNLNQRNAVLGKEAFTCRNRGLRRKPEWASSANPRNLHLRGRRIAA